MNLKLVEVVQDSLIVGVYSSELSQAFQEQILCVVSASYHRLGQVHDTLLQEVILGIQRYHNL